MNEVRKETLRIVNLVMEINDRGVAMLDVNVCGFGAPLKVVEWLDPETELRVGRHWVSAGQPALPYLRKIRHDLERMLQRAKLPLPIVEEVV